MNTHFACPTVTPSIANPRCCSISFRLAIWYYQKISIIKRCLILPALKFTLLSFGIEKTFMLVALDIEPNLCYWWGEIFCALAEPEKVIFMVITSHSPMERFARFALAIALTATA